MLRWALIAVLAMWFCAAEAAGTPDLGRYHALVIGSNDYRHMPKLKTAVDDARSVHAVLTSEYGFRSQLLLNPDRYTLLRALDTLRAELTENDNLLIYYAGHGVLDRETDQGFWLPVDAEEESQANWIPVFHVTSILRAVAAKHVLIVADSCYSGTLTRDAPALRIVGDADRLQEISRLAAKRSRKALVSGGLEPVVDGGGGGHSVFARAFLDALREADEIIDGYELFRRIRQPVMVNAAQTPKYADIRMAGDEGGDFLFAPRRALTAPAPAPVPAPAPAAAPPPGDDIARQVELAHWEQVKDANSVAVLETYLARYPNGLFADVVRARIAKLDERARAPAPTPAPTPSAPVRTGLVAPPATAFGRQDGTWRGWHSTCLPPRAGAAKKETELELIVSAGRVEGYLGIGGYYRGPVEGQLGADGAFSFPLPEAQGTGHVSFDPERGEATARLGAECSLAMRRAEGGAPSAPSPTAPPDAAVRTARATQPASTAGGHDGTWRGGRLSCVSPRPGVDAREVELELIVSGYRVRGALAVGGGIYRFTQELAGELQAGDAFTFPLPNGVGVGRVDFAKGRDEASVRIGRNCAFPLRQVSK